MQLLAGAEEGEEDDAMAFGELFVDLEDAEGVAGCRRWGRR